MGDQDLTVRHGGDVAAIDAWLPQTQCTLCGYPRCHEYAAALAKGEADINQCPPGGEITINGLAGLLSTPVKPLNPSNGEHKPRHTLIIDEQTCIGCTLCIQVCPVDAIVGANKLMHTIVQSECTGCDLCLPVCPVDCIDVVPLPAPATGDHGRWPEYPSARTERARRRCNQRIERLSNRAQDRILKNKHVSLRRDPNAGETIRSEIEAVLARAEKPRR